MGSFEIRMISAISALGRKPGPAPAHLCTGVVSSLPELRVCLLIFELFLLQLSPLL